MRIIPAIDIIDGKCVRLSKGDYNTQKIYNEHPLEVAKAFESHGINYLHVVDLDGAKNGQITNYKILEQLASKTNLKIDFGGGLKSDADLKIAFECGASQITGGSIAVKNPELFQQWISSYGAERIILGADQNNGKIAVSGWTETSELELVPFMQAYIQKGITTVICTDISKDGMLEGPNVALYKQLITEIPALQLIASGGITHLSDLQKVAAVGCEGAILGKSIYEGIISLKQLEQYILSPKSFESC